MPPSTDQPLFGRCPTCGGRCRIVTQVPKPDRIINYRECKQGCTRITTEERLKVRGPKNRNRAIRRAVKDAQAQAEPGQGRMVEGGSMPAESQAD